MNCVKDKEKQAIFNNRSALVNVETGIVEALARSSDGLVLQCQDYISSWLAVVQGD